MHLRNEIISGKQNPGIVGAAALREKKYRRERREFLCDGKKLFLELCAAHGDVLTVYLRSDTATELYPLIERGEALLGRETDVCRVAPEVFSKLTDEAASEGIVTRAGFFTALHREAAEYSAPAGEPRELMLCALRDPGNLGTVIRSALAFGVRGLLLSSDCADIYSQKTLRAAMGAVFRLDITVFPSLLTVVDGLRKNGARRVLAAELREGAVPVCEAHPVPGDVLIIGNEGSGIPPELSAACDASVYIPISPVSESLNAAAAASVLLWIQHSGEAGGAK